MPIVFELPPAGLYPQIERCYYTDPFGVITDFTTDLTQQFKDGVEGRFMPTFQHLTDSVPEMDGARYRGTRALSRLVDVPMTFLASDTQHMRSMFRSLASGLNPKKGIGGPQLGTLWVLTTDGLVRYISCLYQDGLSQSKGGTDTANTDSIPLRTIVLEFIAFDPYWYDEALTVEFADTNNSDDSFLPMNLPMTLANSTVVGKFDINNPGDAAADPIWIIYGPGENVILENETTGETLSLTWTLRAGENIQIDCRPGYSTITLNDGTNLFPVMSGALFTIPQGASTISISMANATDASNVVLQYRPKFHSV